MERGSSHGLSSVGSSKSPSTSAASTPQRSQSQQQSVSSSPARSATEPAKGGNAFSKFFTQLRNLIVEAANIEPTSDVAPGVDHCCKTSRCHYGLPIHHDSELAFNTSCASTSSSSNAYPQVSSRLIVYRDCDRRGRKILFDSEHVSSDYVYLKPSDPKLLKDLGEYVFGCVPLAAVSSSTMDDTSCGHKRFCKWNLEDQSKTLYIWSKLFELGSYNSNRTKQSENSPTTVDYSSSSSDHSSSGYDSSGVSSSSGSTVTNKTFSLPLFNQRPSSRSSSQQSFPQTRSLPGRIDSYKTNLALVWIFTQDTSSNNSSSSGSSSANNYKIPFLYLSPLVEKLMLNPLSCITRNFYHNSNHFVTSLKNISTSLHHDLTDFLSNPHVVNLSLVKPPLTDMVNPKLVTKLLELLLTNVDSCIVLNLKKWTEVKAVLYFLKMFLKTCVCRCSLMDILRRESLVETGTDVISATHELDGVDSGIELENSSSSRFQTVSSSSLYGRKWSIVSEESELGSSQEEEDQGRVSFHLGDADVDQSEAKLCLGEIDLSRLKGSDHRRPSVESIQDVPSPTKRPPLEVTLNLGESKLKDSCPVKYNPCYHCNGTYITKNNRFNPFYFCQIMAKPGQVAYDYEYVSFMKIIELYGNGNTRSFNLSDELSNSGGSSSSGVSTGGTSFTSISEEEPTGGDELSRKVKEFVEGYVTLSKDTNDAGKLNHFVSFQLEEIRDYFL